MTINQYSSILILSNIERNSYMKSLRHIRLLKNAELPNPQMTVEDINRERSFGAKLFKKKTVRRKMANRSRRTNRAV